jgi:3',5'-cyclic AMP phosphodiesterase CpdA
MPTTMILRFRDLSGKTIEGHQKILATHHQVWWGWWNKPEERIPRQAFADFADVIEREGKLTVFLLDSGSKQLYRAVMTSIAPSPTDTPHASPDPDNTPSYYNKEQYRAWFRFEKIEAALEADLRKFSYDEIAEFSDPGERNIYHSKRVDSISEILERRHKTIWFLQPFEKGHRTDRISPAILRAPESFEPAPFVTKSPYLVQLSDVHFNPEHHAFDITGGDLHLSLANSVITDLRTSRRDQPPAAVLLTGDFTWLGTAAEFDLALDFVQRLQSAFDLKSEQLILLPGNHDIQWGSQGSTEYDPTQPVALPSDQAESNYRDFAAKVTGFAPGSYLSMGRRYILGNYLALDVVALNSSRLEQRHFAGFGFVQRTQLEDAAARMGWHVDDAPRVHYRLLALHHHVVPVVPAEEIKELDPSYSLTLDAGQITYAALRYGVDLIVHGHQHHPFAGSLARPPHGEDFQAGRSLAIHGAGSAGVKRGHIGPGGRNSYSVLTFSESGVEIEVRSTSSNEQGFAPEWTCFFARHPAGGLQTGARA